MPLWVGWWVVWWVDGCAVAAAVADAAVTTTFMSSTEPSAPEQYRPGTSQAFYTPAPRLPPARHSPGAKPVRRLDKPATTSLAGDGRPTGHVVSGLIRPLDAAAWPCCSRPRYLSREQLIGTPDQATGCRARRREDDVARICAVISDISVGHRGGGAAPAGDARAAGWGVCWVPRMGVLDPPRRFLCRSAGSAV